MGLIRVPYETLLTEIPRALARNGLSESRAEAIGRVLAESTRDGVNSHGLNRVRQIVRQIRDGMIDPEAGPSVVGSFGAWEQWDGNRGPGILNALTATDRAMELAGEHGIGSVAMRRTTHWQRGGTYGWRAAEAGFGLIAWTNTIPNTLPYGSFDSRVGNNPLVMAVPRKAGPVVLDIAMSQFSFGRLSTHRRRGEPLPVPGGYDESGQPTCDAAAVLDTRRALAMGYWKGAGLGIVLDLLGAVMSKGLTAPEIEAQEGLYDVSQVFIAVDVSRAGPAEQLERTVNEYIEFLHSARPAWDGAEVLYPGERSMRSRENSLTDGVPVDEAVWDDVRTL